MDALRLTGRRQVEIVALDEPPRPPADDEALVAVRRVTLCGSDYALFEGSYRGPCTYPVRFGHEWSGVVLEAGRGTGLRGGEIVTGDCSVWCGSCPQCALDRNLCRAIEKYGITRDGFSAEVVRVPARYLYPDRHGLGFELLALTEVFAVALHAIHRAGSRPSEPDGPTLVSGAGPVGLAVYLLLWHAFGWRRLELFDPAESRLEFLRARFPEHALTSELHPEGSVARSYAEIQRRARYALVFETSGAAAAVDTAVDVAAPRGTVVLLAVPAGAAQAGPVVLKALGLLGSIGGTGEFHEVMDFFARHTELARRCVTASFPYRRAQAAFEADRVHNLKVQLDFESREEARP
jgi:threonine dehydrogenase-like Zn-dependent dehydrogenase